MLHVLQSFYNRISTCIYVVGIAPLVRNKTRGLSHEIKGVMRVAAYEGDVAHVFLGKQFEPVVGEVPFLCLRLLRVFRVRRALPRDREVGDDDNLVRALSSQEPFERSEVVEGRKGLLEAVDFRTCSPGVDGGPHGGTKDPRVFHARDRAILQKVHVVKVSKEPRVHLKEFVVRVHGGVELVVAGNEDHDVPRAGTVGHKVHEHDVVELPDVARENQVRGRAGNVGDHVVELEMEVRDHLKLFHFCK